MNTERQSPRYADIDSWDLSDALEAMIDGQFAALAAVRAARKSIEQAAIAMEGRLRYRGRLIYAGAGTSGRLAVQDGAELMPTFSWPRERLALIMAGGAPALTPPFRGGGDLGGKGAQGGRESGVGLRGGGGAGAAGGAT